MFAGRPPFAFLRWFQPFCLGQPFFVCHQHLWFGLSFFVIGICGLFFLSFFLSFFFFFFFFFFLSQAFVYSFFLTRPFLLQAFVLDLLSLPSFFLNVLRC